MFRRRFLKAITGFCVAPSLGSLSSPVRGSSRSHIVRGISSHKLYISKECLEDIQKWKVNQNENYPPHFRGPINS